MMYHTIMCNGFLQQMQLLCTTAPSITNVLPVVLQRRCVPSFARKGVIYRLPPTTTTDFRKLSLVIEGLAFISWKKVDTVRWVENKSNKDHHHCMTSWPAKQQNILHSESAS